MKSSAARPRMLAAAACALVFAAVSTAGCTAAQHQVVGSGESCSSCHSEEKAVFDLGVEPPAGTIESGSSVTVKTDARVVAVCEPAFTAQDGSSFVPTEASSVTVVDGEAVVQLQDGLWALCVDEGDSARARLVQADSGNSEAVVVEL